MYIIYVHLKFNLKTFIPLHLDKNWVTFFVFKSNSHEWSILTFKKIVVLNTFHLVTYLEFQFCSLLLFKLVFKIAFFICLIVESVLKKNYAHVVDILERKKFWWFLPCEENKNLEITFILLENVEVFFSKQNV